MAKTPKKKVETPEDIINKIIKKNPGLTLEQATIIYNKLQTQQTPQEPTESSKGLSEVVSKLEKDNKEEKERTRNIERNTKTTADILKEQQKKSDVPSKDRDERQREAEDLRKEIADIKSELVFGLDKKIEGIGGSFENILLGQLPGLAPIFGGVRSIFSGIKNVKETVNRREELKNELEAKRIQLRELNESEKTNDLLGNLYSFFETKEERELARDERNAEIQAQKEKLSSEERYQEKTRAVEAAEEAVGSKMGFGPKGTSEILRSKEAKGGLFNMIWDMVSESLKVYLGGTLSVFLLKKSPALRKVVGKTFENLPFLKRILPNIAEAFQEASEVSKVPTAVPWYKKMFGKGASAEAPSVLSTSEKVVQDAAGNWRYGKGAVDAAGKSIAGRFAKTPVVGTAAETAAKSGIGKGFGKVLGKLAIPIAGGLQLLETGSEVSAIEEEKRKGRLTEAQSQRAKSRAIGRGVGGFGGMLGGAAIGGAIGTGLGTLAAGALTAGTGGAGIVAAPWIIGGSELAGSMIGGMLGGEGGAALGGGIAGAEAKPVSETKKKATSIINGKTGKEAQKKLDIPDILGGEGGAALGGGIAGAEETKKKATSIINGKTGKEVQKKLDIPDILGGEGGAALGGGIAGAEAKPVSETKKKATSIINGKTGKEVQKKLDIPGMLRKGISALVEGIFSIPKAAVSNIVNIAKIGDRILRWVAKRLNPFNMDKDSAQLWREAEYESETDVVGSVGNKTVGGIGGFFSNLMQKMGLQPSANLPSTPGGVGGGNAATGVGESGSSSEGMKFFQSRGWTKEQSAGIVGNLQAESGKDMKTNATGDNGQAYGIAQWHPDRQRKFAEVMGKDIRQSSFKEQLAFVDWELKNTEKNAGDRIREATTADQAAAAVDIYYERSSGTTRGQRQSNALALMKGGQGTSTPGSTATGISTSPSGTKGAPTSGTPRTAMPKPVAPGAEVKTANARTPAPITQGTTQQPASNVNIVSNNSSAQKGAKEKSGAKNPNIMDMLSTAYHTGSLSVLLGKG